MNTTPCGNCAHFDQQTKYKGGKETNSWYGWCKKRSVYPHQPWDSARPFDVDVKRVAKGTNISNPVIVQPDGVVKDCTDCVPVKK